MQQEFPKMKVKITQNDDTRLWRYESMDDFQGLQSFISSTWSTPDFIAQYEDEEGDKITIASQQDLRDAFAFARSEQKKSLKIFVQSKTPKAAAATAQDNDDNDNDNDDNAAPGTDQQQPQPPQKFDSTHEMMVDFMSHGDIQALMPEFFAAVVDKVMRADGSLSVEQITGLLFTELAEAKYAAVTAHPLYRAYGVMVVPCIATRMHRQQSLYPHFRLGTIKHWIVQLVAMLRRNLPRLQEKLQAKGKKCAFKDIVIDVEYPQMTDTGKVIHFGVECNLCGEFPIIGDRYKCSICENWDCCPRCEPKHFHPLIKFKKSSAQHQNAAFKGLSEIMQRLSGVELKNDEDEDGDAAVAEGGDNDEEVAVAQAVASAADSWCDCICGAKLQSVMARFAYPRTTSVCCDGCAETLVNETVYHCPKGYDAAHHAHGFDLCGACAQQQIKSQKSLCRRSKSKRQQQPQQQESVPPQVDIDVDADVKPQEDVAVPVDVVAEASPASVAVESVESEEFVNVVAVAADAHDDDDDANEHELKNEVVDNAPVVEAVVDPKQWLTAQLLLTKRPAEQKRLIGEQLFPKVQSIEPKLAGKITGMLLEMDSVQCLGLLSDEQALMAKISEAFSVLKAAQEKAEQQAHAAKVEQEFVYAQQLQQIKMLMNFGDDKDTVLRQLLVQHKGDASRVVNALFAE